MTYDYYCANEKKIYNIFKKIIEKKALPNYMDFFTPKQSIKDHGNVVLNSTFIVYVWINIFDSIVLP